MEYVIYVDAGYRKGTGGHISWLNQTTGKRFYAKLDCKDSFQCEVQAVLRAIQDHKELLETYEILILVDNRTVADQLNSKAGINSEEARRNFLKIWELTAGKKVRFGWIERKQNKAGKILGS